MRAIVAPDLTLADVPEPEPRSDEAVVRLTATSLNRGEAKAAQHGTPGAVWGWDVVGTVEHQAADGSGPPRGTRVVGLKQLGAWSQRTAVATDRLAPIPDAVTDGQAATLPVAGLTALRTLDRLGPIVGKELLVTGASGGVGRFLLQLARLGGARPTAVARRRQGLRELGAAEVLDTPPDQQRFDGALESVGGDTLARALKALKPGGTLVQFGASDEGDLTVHPRVIYGNGLRYEGFLVFRELDDGSGTRSFERLLGLVAQGDLDCSIAAEASWSEAPQAARQLLDRRVDGKYVLYAD